AKRPKLHTPDDRMTLRDHLAELRMRIVRSCLAIIIGVIVIMAFYEPVLEFLSQPYRDLCDRRPKMHCDGRLSTLSALDGFSTRITISLYGGILLALPVILWQIWRFVVPALHAKEKKYAIPFIFSTVFLFLLGGAIAYWTLELALEFLISWSGGTDQVTQLFEIKRYMSLVGLMIAAYGIGFEFPVLLVFLQLVGVLSPQTLVRGWRYAVMVIFVIAAVITPSGDPFSMLALAIPMTIFYFIAVLIGWLIQRNRRAKEATEDAAG
ncbi:MAG TPA: twin-arginine translocase subunit TatC, partial [Ilumatobacteraceae bacterium]|nr:twin-arginine translocase subunit TatC [Ilumatobacteraceae bacterium]